MISRRQTRTIHVGNVPIGGDSPIAVQSMCNTDTRDIEATVTQIEQLQAAGCEIIRVAVLNQDAAVAIRSIRDRNLYSIDWRYSF